MLTDQTLTKLTRLKLEGMAHRYADQRQDPRISDLSFDERFGVLVDAEHDFQHNRAFQRRIKGAKMRVPHACLENIDYRVERGLKRSLIDQLRDSQWIQQHQSLVITGSTGTGKSYLACAFAHQACRDGYRACYTYAPMLYRDLLAAAVDGTMDRLLRRLRRVDLLVVDDFGLADAKAAQHRYFLEVLDERTQAGAVIVTSQYPLKAWHELIGDGTIADAIVDRLMHHAYQINFLDDAESMRQHYGPGN